MISFCAMFQDKWYIEREMKVFSFNTYYGAWPEGSVVVVKSVVRTLVSVTYTATVTTPPFSISVVV